MDAKRENGRRTLAVAAAVAAASLTGCMGPTYGTGHSQVETLFSDLNNSLLLGGGGDGSQEVAYAPRKKLETPENTSVLPRPTDGRSRAAAEARREAAARRQVEVREQTAAQIRASGNAGASYDFSKNSDEAGVLSPQELEEAGAQARRLESRKRAGNPNQRQYLTEPPTTYRQPSSAAPVGQMGEDESVKEQRLENKGKSVFGRLGDLFS